MSDILKKEIKKIPERIENGIEFLDRRAGLGWPHQIDLERFNVDHAELCVCGQLGIHFLFVNDTIEKGFFYPDVIRHYEKDISVYSKELQKAWEEKIEKLKLERKS